MKIKACGLCALVAVLAGSSILATPMATLTLQSQPGDPIGGGGTYAINYPVSGTPVNDQIFPQVLQTLPNGSPTEVLIVLGPVTNYTVDASLYFGTQALGIPIQPGTYTNAQRDPFESPGHPGLFVAFQNNGCNTLTGSFVITDATFLADNTISSFSASFEQHCDGAIPALFGTITYNANDPTPVPEPAGYSLMGIGLSLSIVRRWRIART